MEPITITVITIAGLIALFGGGAVLLNWNAVIETLKGKYIAIFGARGVGKTALATFLESGELPKGYEQTKEALPMSGKRLKLSQLALLTGVAEEEASTARILKKQGFFRRLLGTKFQDHTDLSGDKAAYKVWKEEFLKADVALYLAKASWIEGADAVAITRIMEDIAQIKRWIGEREKDTRPLRIYFIVTHCDLQRDFLTDRASYQDRLTQNTVLTTCITMLNSKTAPKLVFGSLVSPEESQRLVFKILKDLEA